MDNVIEQQPSQVRRQQSDNEQEGKQLFDEMSMSDNNPFENLELSSVNVPQHQQVQQENEEKELKQPEEQGVNFRQMMKQSKKQKKREKKKSKLRQAKSKQPLKKQNISSNIIVENNKKRVKKMVLDSDDDEQLKKQQEQQVVKQVKQKQSKKIKKNLRKHSQSDNNQHPVDDDHDDSAESYSNSSSQQQDNILSHQSVHKNHNKIQQQQAASNNNQSGIKKRLGRKSRMQRILQKQGFDLKQLGNQGQANYELNQSVNESDDSFSSNQGKKNKRSNKKGKKEKKEKKQLLTNEQFLSKLKEIGCEDDVEENDSERYNYDSGIEELTKLRPKKQFKNTIKVQNKLFGNLQMQIEQQVNSQQVNQCPQGEVPTEKLELQFKPKLTTTSRAGSFLNKVQTLKKHRGLQADIDQVQFDRIAKQKAKRSITQLVSKIQNEIEENEEIDIEIKAPTIAKGKSADLINNTMFIVKNLNNSRNGNNNVNMSVESIDGGGERLNGLKRNSSENVGQTTVKQLANYQTTSFATANSIKKKPVSRVQFFRQIQQSINVRRSKYVSAQQLKNSFKPSKLEQLEQIRQRRQQRRKKEVMYNMGEIEDDDAEEVIKELEDEVARNDRISKEELRRLLREEQGMDQLDQYEEGEGDVNGKKNKKQQVNTEKTQKNNKQLTEEEKNIIKSNTQNITANASHQNKPNTNQPMIEKDSTSQLQKHADDMIDEYDQQLAQNQQQQMDPQQQDGDYQHQQDDEQQQQEEDQQQEEQQENEQQQQSSQKDNDQQVEGQQQKKKQDDDKLRKELQQEGIIMPGANNKRKTHTTNDNQQIDPSKYIIPSSHTSQLIVASNNLLSQNSNQPIILLKNNKQQTLQFKQFRKLRKIAVVIQQKKKKRQEQLKRAKEYFENQAQLGSDNEENDDNVKAINRKDDSQEEDSDDLDKQLEELIDNAVDINEEDQDLAFRKYMQDVKEKDREELQKILRGDFRRHNQDMPELHQMQEDEKNRYDRMQKMMEWMRRREDDDKGLYADDSNDDDDECNFYYDYNGNRKRINHKQKINAEVHEEEMPQENEQEVEQKLRYFLMDTLSPAKAQTYQSKPTQLLTQLPQMFKKTNKPFNKPFAKFDLGLNKKDDQKKQQKQQQQKLNNFAGSLFSLGSNKGQANGLNIPRSKKTSHMSQELNKNKVQKSVGAAAAFSQNKLNSLFSKFSKPIKK